MDPRGWTDRDWRKKQQGLTPSDHAPVWVDLDGSRPAAPQGAQQDGPGLFPNLAPKNGTSAALTVPSQFPSRGATTSSTTGLEALHELLGRPPSWPLRSRPEAAGRHPARLRLLPDPYP